jgi:hypothetical protein
VIEHTECIAIERTDKSQILYIWTFFFTLVNLLAVLLSNDLC